MKCRVNSQGTTLWANDKEQPHREDGPAVEYRSGSTEWWYNGQLHRVDGPAINYINCSQEWFQYGNRHRLDGPALITYHMMNTIQSWFFNGELVEVNSQKEFERWLKLKSFI